MIIVDTALQKRAAAGNPITVGLAGAGFMGRGIINQLANYTPGIKLVAVFSRDPEHARTACIGGGLDKIRMSDSPADVRKAISSNECVVTANPAVLTDSDGIDVLVDATGAVEFGASFALAAIQNGRHLIMMNAEVDGTVGPILKEYADRAGVVGVKRQA